MAFLIGVILLILFVLGCYLTFKHKLKKMFGIDLSEVNYKNVSSLIEEDHPKTVGSMDNLYLDNLKNDFNDLNLNEIKRMAEKEIIGYLEAIESRKYKKIKNDKLKEVIKSKIKDNLDKNVKYDYIKFHNTVLNRYENKDGVATITIASSIEYIDENSKKVQTRFKVEYIYIIDSDKVPIKLKTIGLNCPNCGSPLKKNEKTTCNYCGSSIIDIVKRVWICNDIIEY